MPSTYTNNSGIEKPGSGEQAGTWGATSNKNFDIIDRALNGVGVITLAGTSHTLTTTDGALSDGQYKVLILAGTPSGTNTVTISPNDQDKIYFVRNTTAKSVVFSQGSGGNATVPSGETKIIYADGAGAGATVSDFTGALAITGNVNATTLDINGTQVTSTAAELNKLDGFTGTVADLNYAKDLRATGVTTTEFNKLDGLTASTAELNVLDGITATTTELNRMDGASPNTIINNKAVIYGSSGQINANDITADDVSADAIVLGSWTIYDSGSTLYFKYGSNNVMKLTSTGALTVENDVTAFGSV